MIAMVIGPGGPPSPDKPETMVISLVFDHVRRRLFLFACCVSLVNRWSGSDLNA